MQNKFKTVRTYIELFLICCGMGWIYEVFWCNMIEHNRGFINNGFLFGPWLPIYGFGIMFILTFLIHFKIENKWAVWAIGAALSTIAELIGSYFMQLISGGWMWDYSDVFLNYQGRIALKPSIMFGILVLIAFIIVPKLKVKLESEEWDTSLHNILFFIFTAAFSADLIYTFTTKVF